LVSTLQAAESSASPDPIAALTNGVHSYRILDHGQDFAVYQTVLANTNEAGQTRFLTNRFTLLETCGFYQDDGAWQRSENVIESFAEGAVAQRGPNKAVFSSDLNSAAVFDITTSGGERLRGGVRTIQLTDVATGRSAVLGTVRATPAELLPPNRLVYRNGFQGIEADVLLVWKHHAFSQNVILRQRPELPPEMNPDTTRLEVVTEFVETPVPVLNEGVVQTPGQPDLVEHVTIGLGPLLAVRGRAFPVAGEAALDLSGGLRAEAGVVVIKQWHELQDARRFVIESASWREIEPYLQELPVAQRADNAAPAKQQVAQTRVWPRTPDAVAKRGPVQVASLPYRPDGFLVDVELSGSSYSYTFLTGETYYIANSFTVGPGTATWEHGCVIKYNLNAYLLVYGPLLFPATQQTPVFTSKDDDSFGDKITGSTGNPTYAAAQALWIYYVPFYTVINNARIRWAQRGVQYDANSGVPVTHWLTDSLFERCQTGVYRNLPSGSLNLVNVTKCNVTTPLAGYGYYSGTMTDAPFCADKSFEGLKTTDPVVFAGNLLAIPPDTMGAVGPSHFVELVNRVIAAYNKDTGLRIELTDTSTFFGVSGPMADPRIIFDQQCQRWVACMIDQDSRNIRLAISKTPLPVPLTSNWDIYTLLVTEPGYATDFTTLGADANGIYVAAHFYVYGLGGVPTSWRQKVVAIKKQLNCIDPSQIFILPTLASPYKWFILQPAVNFDTVGPDAIAWFAAKGDPGSTHGPIHCGRLKWINGQPQFLEDPWSNTLSVAQAYYDLDDKTSFLAPQKPYDATYNKKLRLSYVGSRLMMAVVRDEHLWTCHHVGVNTQGGYSGESESALRSAVQWVRIQTSPSLNIVASGRVYDPASSNPYWYHFPSLTVSSQGDMLMAFSGSKTTEHIGALFAGRRADGSMPAKPILIQGGRSYFNDDRWGDYSYTCLDPDGLTFWTIQQYAELPFSPPDPQSTAYGTWIWKGKKNP
jgi:hypothetical protein